MTVREAIYMVIEDYHKGIPTDDNRLRPRRVYQALLAARDNIYSKRKANLESFKTFVSCIPLIETNFHECQCVPIAGCTIHKADCLVGDAIDETLYMTSISGELYDRTFWERVGDIANERYTRNRTRWFLRNGIPYVINSKHPVVAISGVVSDPAALFACSCNSGADSCESPLDSDFPIDPRFRAEMIDMARQLIFGLQTKEDKTNDGKEQTS